jgi:hypothetical protein
MASAAVEGSGLDLTVATTLMLCPPESLSAEFLLLLESAVSWVIRDGELALSLPADAGIVVFHPTLPPGEAEGTPPASG